MQEFNDAKQNLEEDPKSKEYWKIQLAKYPPAFYYSVIDAIQLSSSLTGEWLRNNMFAIIKQRQYIFFNINSHSFKIAKRRIIRCDFRA